MRSFFRQPITWMITAEVLVVVALAAFAWHEVAATGSGVAAPVAFPALASPQDGTPQPPDDALTPPAATSAPLLPGLNVDPAFWRARLAGLNEAEVQFEALEWRIIHSAMDTASRYVRTVVIPAIQHAEKGGGQAR